MKKLSTTLTPLVDKHSAAGYPGDEPALALNGDDGVLPLITATHPTAGVASRPHLYTGKQPRTAL
ncbi:hypothetical protein [Streptomyces diastaticus]|uniref:hypothetical protein n=1 Tax=Streptomyces diastaticus TaxID=1956 RepID=UPI00365276A5